MAEKGVIREKVQTFEEFSAEEKKHREAVWKQQQSSVSRASRGPEFRGWLQGKPDPEEVAPYPKHDMASPSGTKLADLFPGAVPGTTHPVPDASLPTTGHQTADRGSTEQIWFGCLMTFVQKYHCCWLTLTASC